MPAPMVSFVPSSTRMNDPVLWLRRYSSTNSGCVVRSLHTADVVQPQLLAALVARQRVDVDAVEELGHLRPRPSAWCA